MKRPWGQALIFSFVLHLGVATFFFKHRPSPTKPAIEHEQALFVELRSLAHSSPGKISPRSSRATALRDTVDVRKLFTLTPGSAPHSGTSSTSNDPASDFESGDTFASEGALVGLEAWGAGAANPFWTHFSGAIHERLKFLSTLYDFESAGKVYISMRFRNDGTLDPQSLRSHSKTPYLQVFTLREICRAFCTPNERIARLVARENPGAVKLRISFVSGARPEYDRDPTPAFRPEGLDIERRLRVSGIQLGKTNVSGSTQKSGDKSLNFAWKIELESLLSKSHRKRYGWDGAKLFNEQKRAFKNELDRLLIEYKQLGWI